MICISIVSHGQGEIAANLLACLARHRPASVAQVIYTRNVPEPAGGPVDLGPISCITIDNLRPRGFGHNHNAAFERCTQPFFCVVNPDIRIESDPFPAMLDCFAENVGLVAPVVVTPDYRVENTARWLYTPRELIGQKLRPLNRAASADWLAGMFMMFRSDAYRGIEGFDESYFLYIEDVDICTRLRLAGWELRQCPDARVIHDARKQSHRSLKYTRWHLAGMLRYWSSASFWRYRALLSRRRKVDAAAPEQAPES